MSFQECEIFETGSRKWRICRNEAGLTARKTDAYRAQWGLQPLFEEVAPKPVETEFAIPAFTFHGHSVSDEKEVRNKLYGPGTELLKSYEAAGCKICEDGKTIAQQMNNWGAAECRNRVKEIVESLVAIPHRSASEDSVTEDVVKAIDTTEAVIADRRARKVNLFTGEKVAGCSTCGKPAKRDPYKKPPKERKSWILKQAERLESLKRAAVDFWQDGMQLATAGQQQARLAICKACPIFMDGWCDQDKGGCGCNIALKVKARSAECPVQKWHAQGDSFRPLTSPTRNLIFHIYPKLGAEWNWDRHIERIREHQHHFNGKIAIGIVSGAGLATHEQVMQKMDGIRVTDWVLKENSKLGETVTMTDLLRIVKTDDPNTITFRGHCKGVTHSRSGIEQPWADILWRTCMDLSSVEDALASHDMAGPLKCHEPLVSEKNKGIWFYAGSFYWFRNREIFQSQWDYTGNNRWAIEAWPDAVCRSEHAACLFFDQMDRHILRHWNTIQEEFEVWKSART